MASGAYSNVSVTFGVQERQTGKVRWAHSNQLACAMQGMRLI